jgi:hypothetical protein
MKLPLRTGLARRGLLVPLALALLTLLLVELGAPPAPSLCLLGDARDYRNAAIAARLQAQEFNTDDMGIGLGRAALGDWNSLGEALLAGGWIYVRSTAAGTPGYYRILHDQRFYTSAFTYLPRSARPVGRHVSDQPQELAAWRQGLVTQYPGGVLVAGYVRFARLATIAISRPAIAGLPVSRHPAHYYTEPRELHHDRWAYVVGVIVRQPLSGGQRTDPMLARLLAPDAQGRSENLIHALVLTVPPSGLDTIPAPEQVMSLGRVTNDSVIAQARLDVYPLHRLAACAPADPATRLATAP